MYAVIETAKANHANVYWYLRYVLETMPQYMSGINRVFIKDMMPWFEKYRQYEQQHISTVSNRVQKLPHEYAEKPHTPSKMKIA